MAGTVSPWGSSFTEAGFPAGTEPDDCCNCFELSVYQSLREFAAGDVEAHGPFDAEGIFHHLDTSEEVNFDILKGPAFAFEQRDSCLRGVRKFEKNLKNAEKKE
jgi:hypothetical protein